MAAPHTLVPQKSTNNRFKQAKYGMKRLAKVERAIEEKLKKQAKRYNKSYQGEMVHFDTKRLPLLQNQKVTDPRDYLFIAIDDFSRELYTAILPDRTVASAAKFLLHDVIDCCPYTVECAYSDNGVEYRGNAGHPFGLACVQNDIEQKFTRIFVNFDNTVKPHTSLKGDTPFEVLQTSCSICGVNNPVNSYT